MCDDLISKHYLYSEQSQTIHPSPPGTTHFTLRPTNATWLFLNVETALNDLGSVRSLLLTHFSRASGKPWTTINSFDPWITTWALREQRLCHLLYEMYLPLDPSPPDTSRSEGFRLAEAKEWFVKNHPGKANVLHKAGEQVFCLVDTRKSIRPKAGFVMVLPDEETRRVYISELEVFEAYRRQGLARYMLTAMGETFRKYWDGEVTVWLTVFATNVDAVGLYFRMGYKVNRKLFVVERNETNRVAQASQE
jgi:ribosomal protein S18 acetylase RimI-like enzyme